VVYGDCSRKNYNDGDVLEMFSGENCEFYDLLEQGKHLGLIKAVERLSFGGRTALGPALLISVAQASCEKPGSSIMICTDGKSV